MKPDGAASSIIADENNRFPKGIYVTGLDGQSGQGIRGISSSEGFAREKWSEDLTSFGYLFIHINKVIEFDAEASADNFHRCLVRRSVYNEKRITASGKF
nr:hypothetical protein [uncultured Prevotella sp.]